MQHPSCFRRLGLLTLILLSFHSARAGSARWNSTPTNDFWFNASNWTPATVPTTTEDTATFGASTITMITFAQFSVGSMVFDPGASAYDITPFNPYDFTMAGAGIINNSGVLQSFELPAVPQHVGDEESDNLFTFGGSASAGTLTHYTIFGSTGADGKTVGAGEIDFTDSSTAAAATIVINPGLGSLTKGDAGFVMFLDSSTADRATLILNGATIPLGNAAQLWFLDNSTAASATFTNNGGTVTQGVGGVILFAGEATAGNATITNNGGSVVGAFNSLTVFADSASAGNATLIANGGGGEGGHIRFFTGTSGGTARIEVFGNGQLDVSAALTGLTTGSLEGDGTVILGAQNLALGTNELSTLFSGVIQDDGGIGDGNGGSFTKTGTGKLTLTNANTYTGGTVIDGGALLVNNTNGSGLGSGPVQVTTGTLGGIGTIAGVVMIGTGHGAGAVLGPGKNSVTPGKLSIGGQLTLQSDASYRVTVNSDASAADKIAAKRVRIGGAQIVFTDGGSGLLPLGTMFTVIDNRGQSSIVGSFNNLADGATVAVGNNNFQADYEGGDGNDLTLTVVP